MTNASPAAMVDRYLQFRAVGMELNSKLARDVPEWGLDACAKRLGLLHQGVLVLDDQNEMDVLLDCCIHQFRWAGKSVAERRLESGVHPPDSDEAILLRAMARSRYCLLRIDEAIPKIGVRATDLIREEEVEIIDIGMSASAEPGLGIACHVMKPDGIGMSTGAGLPIPPESFHRYETMLRGFRRKWGTDDLGGLGEAERGELAMTMIAALLHDEAASRINYFDLSGEEEEGWEGEERAHFRAAAPVIPVSRVPLNAACPCGSGKKYKKCCGAKRPGAVPA